MSNNEILVVTDCKRDGGNCEPATYTDQGSRTVTLQLVDVASPGSPAVPQFNHDDSGLTDVAAVEFSADTSTSKVFLVIEKIANFGLPLTPASGPYVEVSTAGAITTFSFVVPSSTEPNFSWELVPQQPGIPLKVTVKRK